MLHMHAHKCIMHVDILLLHEEDVGNLSESIKMDLSRNLCNFYLCDFTFRALWV